VRGGRVVLDGRPESGPHGKNYDPEAYNWERPVSLERIPRFWIERYPLTVQAYARFIEAAGYKKQDWWSTGGYGEFSEPQEWQRQLPYPNRPVVGVSWWEAAAFCAWNTSRLPSAAEWEFAARCGRDGARYPWGDELPDEFRANFRQENSPAQIAPVGMYPEGSTSTGIQDLAGNVLEWAATNEVRGGCWLDDQKSLRVSFRLRYDPQSRTSFIGFRCVRDLHPPKPNPQP
jgi:iron(II)-dependent oxidoreductase